MIHDIGTIHSKVKKFERNMVLEYGGVTVDRYYYDTGENTMVLVNEVCKVILFGLGNKSISN